MSNLSPSIRVTLGLATALAGVAMLVLPGPGLLTLAAAVHMLAHDLPFLRPLRERLGGPATA